MCPRTQPYVFVSAGIGNGGGNGLNTGLLRDGEGEPIQLADDSGKLLASVTFSPPVKVPEVNQDIMGKLDQQDMNILDSLDTTGITSQVSSA